MRTEFTDEELYREDNLVRLRGFRPIDDTLFRAMVRDNKALAEYILRVFLQKPDLELEDLKVQADLKMVNGARSLVLDVLARGGDRSKYDLEVQKDNEGADPRRARYHASVIDEQSSYQGEKFSDMIDIYVVFITENDVPGNGLALNPVERVYTKTGKLFNDGMHIMYVNGAYRGDDEVGQLIHDFMCTDPDDMKNELMARAAHHYKKESEGVREMCLTMEKLRDESLKKGREEGRAEGRTEDVINLMESMSLDCETAMAVLKIKAEDRPAIKTLVEEKMQGVPA